MILCGYEKFSMVDFDGKIACTVFTGGCNFRCPFCHNAPLVVGNVKSQQIDCNEVFDYLQKRKGLVDAVCVTGGEPTLQPDLCDFLAKVRDMGYATKLDTNGLRPDVLKEVLDKKLVDFVAMDVKNSPVRYAQTVGAVELDLTPIDKSVSFLLRGTVDYEFRTTAVAEIHDDASFLSLADWLAGARRYYIQRFQPRDTVLRAGLSAPSEMQLHCWAELVRPKIPAVEIRGI